MKVFRTKEFAKFSRREKIADVQLCEAAERADNGLVDADLGGGLIKQRIARPGQGRSGGYRTLMAFRSKARTVFVYGFAKNERGNIDHDELKYWQQVARSFLQMDETSLNTLIGKFELMEVVCHGETGIP